MRKHKPFPVPEAVIDGRCVWYVLDAGPVKYIFIDRNAGTEGNPCWLIYVPDHNLVYRAKEWHTVSTGPGSGVYGRGNRDAPLKPDGPAFWVETVAAIEVTV